MMIDVHCHILAGVDDGARDIEESIAMIKEALNNGITSMVVTPHYMIDSMDAPIEVIRKRFTELCEAIKKENIEMDLYLGQELYLESRLIEDLQDEKCISINNTKYIMVELPLNGMLLSLETLLFELKILGYKVILAHGERYTFLQDSPEKLRELIDEGLLIQMNLSSLSGKYGKATKKLAKKMIKNRWVHLLGSDMHRKNSLSISIKKPLKYIQKKQGKVWLHQLKYTFPQEVLNGEPLSSITKKRKHKGLKWISILLILLFIIVQGVHFGIKKVENQFEAIMIEQGKAYKKEKLRIEAEEARKIIEAEAEAKAKREALRALEKEEREAKRKAEDIKRAAELEALELEIQEEAKRLEEAMIKAKNEEERRRVEQEAEQLKNRMEKEQLKAEMEAEALKQARLEEEKEVLDAIKLEEARLEEARLEAERIAQEEKARLEAELEAKYTDYETDKAKAMDLALSKLSVSQVNDLIKMASGGFTSQEKKVAKEMFYNNFTESEQEWILEMYAKYYGG